MELGDIREAVRAAIKDRTVDGDEPFSDVQVLSYMGAQSPPTIWVMGPEEIDYHITSVDGSTWKLRIQGFAAGGASEESAQRLVDAWLSDSGAHSVKEALEADRTLGGIAEDVIVRTSEGYALYVVDDLGVVLGCDWIVEIVA